MDNKLWNKNEKIVGLKIIISILIISFVYVIFFKDKSDANLDRMIAQLPFGNDSIFWYILVAISICLTAFYIWDGFVKKKGHKYCNFIEGLESAPLGETFTSLSDEEKSKAIKRAKILLVSGIIFVVIFIFFLIRFLDSSAGV